MTTNETNTKPEGAPKTEIVDGIEVTDETGHDEATKETAMATKKKTGKKTTGGTKGTPKKTTTKAKTDGETTTKKAATTKTQTDGKATTKEKATTNEKPATNAKAETKPTKKAASKKDEPADATSDAPKATLTTKNLTLGQLPDAYGADLADRGKTEKTVASYKADLRVAAKYFGEDTQISTLTAKQVAEYFDSDAVCANRGGKRRSEITIAKVRRTFRMALERLAEIGAIKSAPVPPKPKKDDAKTDAKK